DGLRLTRPSRLTTLHSASDALRVRDWLPLRDARALVLGAGLVGSETASVLAEYGVAVTLVSASPLPLRAQLGPEIASALVARHREAVAIRFGRHVVGVDGGRDAIRVELDRGEILEADVAVVAYGTVPLRPWFLGTEEGAIPVDGRLRTPVRGVYAAGGVASVHDGTSQTRVDHWDDAEAQGRHAARAMLHDLAGAPDPGAHRFLAAFSSRIHGATLSGWGVAGPTTRWHQPVPRIAMSIGTAGGRTTTAVGLDAAAAVRAARDAEIGAAATADRTAA
ncbi:MAG TPA: FAD-dependent oxidoreductase, partial [Agromyces sp.]